MPLAPTPNISIAVPSLPRKKKAPIIIIGENMFIPKANPLLIYLVTSPNDVLKPVRIIDEIIIIIAAVPPIKAVDSDPINPNFLMNIISIIKAKGVAIAITFVPIDPLLL